MKSFKLLRNAAGISLVEVMMAVSVVGGLSLTVAQLMKNTSESTKQNEAKQENVNLKGLLQDNLNNTTACTNTFGAIMTPANVTALSGSPTASVTIPNVKDKINAIKYSTTSTNIQPLTITSMSLTNYNATAFTGDFLVNATFKKSTNNIVMVKPIRIPINFSFSGTTLTACSTMAVGGEWMLGGNAGTVDGTDYVGTSDIAPLNFRVNAQKSGRIDNAGQTFLGYQAGANLPYGTSGTAFGYNALRSDFQKGKNAAFGYNALALNNSGDRNTAIGDATLESNTSGALNTALGSGALMRNGTGNNNTGLGVGSLAYLTSGSSNTGVGYYAAYRTSGSNNTGVGTMAIYGTSGSDNVALGYNAGRYNSNGSYNTFIGTNSAPSLITGTNNIFIGNNSGGGITTASNKLFIESIAGNWPLIAGDFSARNLNLNGKVQIDSSPLIPASSLAVGNHAGISSTKVHIFDDSGQTNARGLGVVISPAGFGDWSRAITASNSSAVSNGGFTVGIQGTAGATTPTSAGRMYGGWFNASNGTSGYNYGLVAALAGTENGTAIFATSTNVFPQDTNAYGVKRWAGIFVGDVRVTGELSSPFPHVISSDRRLKKDIKPLHNSLEKIVKLRGVTYRWKKVNPAEPTNREQIGFIAQEVEKQFPQLVSTTKTEEGEVKALQYSQFVSPIIEAIKELYAKFLVLVSSDEKQNLEIKTLKAENEKLKNQMKAQQESFEVRMKKLEAEVAKQKPAIK
jgi:type II secretory pathway pseudopilin PulG